MTVTIGEAARASGVPAKTIRYYESVGLIPAAVRADNGYRYYSDRDVQVLRFVHRARSLGFSMEDVANLLALWYDRDRASAAVKSLARSHIEEIDRKMVELASIRATLDDLVARCQGDHRPDCPILQELSGGVAVEPPRPQTGRRPAGQG